MIDAKDLLKDTYQTITDGIVSLENLLPAVENEDMNYDMNRQLQNYRKMAFMCKEELQRQGEVLGEGLSEREKSAWETNLSFKDKLHVGYRVENNSDVLIAQQIVDDIKERVDHVRRFSEESLSEAVNSITMEVIEEEENHMDWMKSYVEEGFHQ